MDSLKQELLQSQKTRDGMMKWKLVLVSAIGAAALGFSQKSPVPHADLALCLIPFACAYVDLLCRNLSIRTKLISRFLSFESERSADSPEARFEAFYAHFDKARRHDALEGLALVYSTVALSLAIVPVGIVSHFDGAPTCENLTQWPSLLFLTAGAMGLLGSLLVSRWYGHQKALINGQGAREWARQRDAASSVNSPAISS